jgi:ATP-dependent Clp protease, protease subunit
MIIKNSLKGGEKTMGKEKSFWKFENVLQEQEAKLYIYGDIVDHDLGDYNYPDDVVPNKFKDELYSLGNVQKIDLHINSNGGSVFAAYAIMNMLKNHKAYITTYIDGIAASAASIIAMAGDKIIMPVGSMFMVHQPMLSMWGNYNTNELEKVINMLNSISDNMIDVYHNRTGLDKKKIKKILNAETWLSPTEALELGFADEIEGIEVVAYLNEDKSTAFFNGQGFKLNKLSKNETLLNTLKVNKTHPNNNKDIKNKEETMNIEVLKNKYPDIYNTALKIGAEAERNRIKAIDEIALAGMEDLSNKAKFESPITAEAYAMEVIKAQKTQGINHINNVNEDAKPLNEIPASNSPLNNSEQESNEKERLLALAKTEGQKIRG